MAELRPNFFIAGAPRCGTTSLWAYLRQHPDIFMCAKEPHAFGRDLDSNGTGRFEEFRELDKYLKLFEKAGAAKRIGDASPFYLYSRSAPSEIRSFDPKAKIIIVLRNPVDMVYSVYQKQLYNFNEDLADFREALEAEGEREQGRRIPKLATNPLGLRYAWLGKYSPHVRRFLEIFGEKQVKIIFFDDLRSQTRETFDDVVQFLELPTCEAIDFQIHNSAEYPRSMFLHAMIGRLWRGSGPTFGQRALGQTLASLVLHPLFVLNTKKSSPPKCAPELRKKLAAEFADDVRALGEITGRDLSRWTHS